MKEWLKIKDSKFKDKTSREIDDLMCKALKPDYMEARFYIYIVNIVYQNEDGDTVFESVFERAKTSAEAVRFVAKNKLPPLTYLDLDKENPLGDYGIIDVKKYTRLLTYTEEEMIEVIRFILSHHYSEKSMSGTKITVSGNENDIIGMLEARYKLSLNRLKCMFK